MQDNPFSEIEFNRQYHTYSLNGQNLTSVSRVVNNLKAPFDAKYWSERKAKERGVSPAVIRQEWDQKREASTQKGEQVHEYIARILRGQPAKSDKFISMSGIFHETLSFNQLWKTLSTAVTVDDLHVEWVVGDATLKIAGTLDALLYDTADEQYLIWDWKTNSKFKTSNPFQTLKPPFDDLDDCELTTYSLQTSLYRLILERNTDLPLGNPYIAHLGPDKHTVHKALDLRERLSEWLATEM